MDLCMVHFKSNYRLITTNNVVLKIVRSTTKTIILRFFHHGLMARKLITPKKDGEGQMLGVISVVNYDAWRS